MIGHMRHGSPPRLMALQSILSPNRPESLPTPSAGVRMTTLSWVTACHSFGGEVEARTPPRYAASTPHAVTNFRAYLCGGEPVMSVVEQVTAQAGVVEDRPRIGPQLTQHRKDSACKTQVDE